jgi:ketosteroid isomerase-like protein
LLTAHVPARAQAPEAQIKRAYRDLIDAENKHDVPAVKAMVWDSASTLFVAKAPTGWHGYWGIEDVTQHLHDMYQTPFRIDPIYSEERVVFITGDIAETYAPVKITVAYGGQNPVPRPFIMVLLWIRTTRGWKMATDIPIPVPPDPAPR